MNESLQELQDALSRIRRGAVALSLWVLTTCENPGCAVEECNLYVSEGPGKRPFQAPLRCARCGMPLRFEGLEDEHNREIYP